MDRRETTRWTTAWLGAALAAATAVPVLAQAPPVAVPATSPAASDRARLTQPQPDRDPALANVYQRFYLTYRLAADDVIAVRLVGQPDYSIESIKVSPLGRIYHPLLGDIEVAGTTIPQLTEKLKTEFAEYFKTPRVSVDLVVASSAKVGVLGEVGQPGIVVMERPMTMLDAIAASGGFTDHGSKSDVTLLRQGTDGVLHSTEVNMKRVVNGKSRPDDNPTLVAGDTIIVHGNAMKKVSAIMSLAGFSGFVNYVRLGTGL